MDITKFQFPELSTVDIIFSTLKTNLELLEEAQKRGFYNGKTSYNTLFGKLFFNGGKIEFKDNLDIEFKEKAWLYCNAFARSFEPKHEEKEAVCAMLMSELLICEEK